MNRRKHLTLGRLEMRDVSQIFKLLENESNISEISRKLGIARSTVREYKVKADGLKLEYQELSKLTTEELEAKFSGKSTGRKPKVLLKKE